MPTAYPKAKQLHYNETVQRYFANKEREGYDLKPYLFILSRPGGIPPKTMIRLAEHLDTDLGELLAHGIGRNNSIDDIDRAAREYYGDKGIGLTDL